MLLFILFLILIFIYLVALDLVVTHGIFSSPTRDRTQAPFVESLESQLLDHQGSPILIFILFTHFYFLCAWTFFNANATVPSGLLILCAGQVFSLLFLVDVAFVSHLVLFPCQLLPLTCLSGKPSCTSAPDTAFFPEVVSLTCYRLALWDEGRKQGLVGVPAPSANIDATIPGIFSLALCWSRLPSARGTAEERRRVREFSSRPLFFPQCPTLLALAPPGVLQYMGLQSRT